MPVARRQSATINNLSREGFTKPPTTSKANGSKINTTPELEGCHLILPQTLSRGPSHPRHTREEDSSRRKALFPLTRTEELFLTSRRFLPTTEVANPQANDLRPRTSVEDSSPVRDQYLRTTEEGSSPARGLYLHTLEGDNSPVRDPFPRTTPAEHCQVSVPFRLTTMVEPRRATSRFLPTTPGVDCQTPNLYLPTTLGASCQARNLSPLTMAVGNSQERPLPRITPTQTMELPTARSRGKWAIQESATLCCHLPEDLADLQTLHNPTSGSRPSRSGIWMI